VTISGTTVTGVGTGSATISGSGWSYSNGATGCSLTGAQLTVTTPVSVSVTITSPNPIPTAVGSGGTIQFQATVTGSSNVAVTWTSTPAAAGTINSSSGLFTAAAVVSTDTMVTVTATAVADTTKFATASFNVTVAAIITNITPPVFRCDAECQMVTETMLGSGFEVGDTVETVPNAWLQLVQLVSSGESLVTMGLDTPHSSPGSFTFSDCRGTTATCSNNWSVAYVGNQNDLAISTSGELYNLDRVIGEIWKFKSDGTPDGEIAGGCSWGEVSITFDAAHNWIWTNCSTGSHAFDAVTGNLVRGGYDGDDLSDSDASDGIYCGTEAISKSLACLDDANMATDSVFAYAPAGVEPWSVTMLTLGLGTQAQETDAIVCDREGTALYFFIVTHPASGGAAVPTITLKTLPGSPATPNPLILNGLTPADTLTGTGNGGWDMVRFETGPAAGTVVLLSAYDKALVFVNASTMTETNRVVLSLPAGFGTPFRIAADETNGRVVVALANVGAAISTTFVAVTPTGAVTPLTAVAQNIIAVGLGVSSDGTNIYACMRNQCQAVPNQ
jgi:hypothetical protein